MISGDIPDNCICAYHFAETVEDKEKKYMLHHPKILTGVLIQTTRMSWLKLPWDTIEYRDFLVLISETEMFKTSQTQEARTICCPLLLLATWRPSLLLCTLSTTTFGCKRRLIWRRVRDLPQRKHNSWPEEEALITGNGTIPLLTMHGRMIRHIWEQQKEWSFDQKIEQEWIKKENGGHCPTGQKTNQKCAAYKSAIS